MSTSQSTLVMPDRHCPTCDSLLVEREGETPFCDSCGVDVDPEIVVHRCPSCGRQVHPCLLVWPCPYRVKRLTGERCERGSASCTANHRSPVTPCKPGRDPDRAEEAIARLVRDEIATIVDS